MFGRLRRLLAAPRPSAAILAAPPPAGREPMSLAERIEMATWCRDCDGLEKVADAGAVVTDADGARVQVMFNGLRVLADGYCGGWMTELIGRCQGHHEPQEERVFHAVMARMPADATMIELGAWWAYYTIWFLRDAPGRRAVAIEPDPERLALGQANAARNGVSPRFRPGFAGGTASAGEGFQLDDGRRLTLPRLTVPGLMADEGWETLDLLHCDTQGAELEVLLSCRELLRSGRIRTLVVSTHHHSISGDALTHQRCLALIEECGGFVIAEHDVAESFSGDGLIAARFGDDAAGWPVVPMSRNRYSTSLFRNPLFDLAERDGMG